MMNKDKIACATLKEGLLKPNERQLKLFYGMLVHAWVSRKAFISTQNFYNLWCELNALCSEADEGFPNPYDDHESLRSFCHTHPYYFIDILNPELVTNLFCQSFDDRLAVLIEVVDKLRTGGLRAAYEYLNAILKLTDNIEESITQAEEHVNAFS